MRVSRSFIIISILHLSPTISAAAPPRSPQIITLPPAVNTSDPYNLTNPTSLNSLPADPALYHVPASTQTILFGRYSRTLPQKDVLSCLLQAANLVIKRLKAGHDGPIDEEEVQTHSGVAHLILKPTEKMTWAMVRTIHLVCSFGLLRETIKLRPCSALLRILPPVYLTR